MPCVFLLVTALASTPPGVNAQQGHVGSHEIRAVEFSSDFILHRQINKSGDQHSGEITGLPYRSTLPFDIFIKQRFVVQDSELLLTFVSPCTTTIIVSSFL